VIEAARIDQIVERHGCKKEHLIAMLQDCQDEFYYLPREVVEGVARRVEVPAAKVLGIATFFRAFSLKPVGRHPISLCMGTACHVQGAPRLLEGLERELGVKVGDTTDDMLFTLKTVNCLGCCGLAPVMTVGKNVHGKLKQSGLSRILKKYSEEKE